MQDRATYTFYRSFWEMMESANDCAKGQFWDAVLKMQFTGEICKPKDPIALMAFNASLFQLKRQLDGFKGATETPPKAPKEAPPEGSVKGASHQGIKNKDTGLKVKESSKTLIEERKKAFALQISPLIDSEFTRQDAREFYEYWTEHGTNDKKMRFEKEKSFGVSRRVATWKKRKKDFAAEKKKDGKITTSEARDRILSGQSSLPRTEWNWNNEPKQIEG